MNKHIYGLKWQENCSEVRKIMKLCLSLFDLKIFLTESRELRSSKNPIYMDVIPALCLNIITTNLSVKNDYCKFQMGTIKK